LTRAGDLGRYELEAQPICFFSSAGRAHRWQMARRALDSCRGIEARSGGPGAAQAFLPVFAFLLIQKWIKQISGNLFGA